MNDFLAVISFLGIVALAIYAVVSIQNYQDKQIKLYNSPCCQVCGTHTIIEKDKLITIGNVVCLPCDQCAYPIKLYQYETAQ